MRNDFFVYVWRRPCGEPFYVGKGKKYRDTAEQGRNPIFRNIVAKIRAGGEEPVVERIFDGITEHEAFAHEVALVAKYGRKNNGTGVLANLTDGGDGVSGWVASAETRARMSAANTGKVLSEDHRAKIGAANKGKAKSEGHRANLSAANKGKALSKDARAKISAANKGKVLSEEHRAKISASLTGKVLSKEVRAKKSAALKGRALSEEHRAKAIAAQRMAPPRVDNKTGYKGVSFSSERLNYKAEISVDGMKKHIGRYPTPEEAARAYDGAAYSAWGRECYLNFPDEIPSNDRPSPLADSEEPPPHAYAA